MSEAAFTSPYCWPCLNHLDLQGGISNRPQRTDVHVDCPYVKVTARVKAASDETNALKEDPIANLSLRFNDVARTAKR